MTADEHLRTAPHSSHYKALVIEPLTFIEANRLNFHEGNVVKYISTWRDKNDGISALRKAQWYLDRLIELAEREGFQAQYDEKEATPGADVHDGRVDTGASPTLPRATAAPPTLPVQA